MEAAFSLGAQDVAAILNCSTRLVHRFGTEGRIRFRKINATARLYHAEDVIALLHKRQSTSVETEASPETSRPSALDLRASASADSKQENI